LGELALAELDAAVLEDRTPEAVPGPAVTALLSPLIRDLLDRRQDRLSHSVETVSRSLRILGRLVDVDACLACRHRGGVAESLRWLKVEPYRSRVAGIDPALLARL
jgi:hypothetical protein